MSPDFQIPSGVEEWGMTAALLFLRVGAIVGLAPVFGEQTVPLRIRLAAALAFVACLFPMIPSLSGETERSLLAQAGAEILTGLAFGMLLRLMVMALQMAGAMMAQAMSLAQIAGSGVAAEPAPAVGNLLVSGGLALAATGGLHVQVLNYLMQSYFLVPLGAWPGAAAFGMAGLAGVGRAAVTAFSLALPFVALSLLYNIMLGIMNRAMPQMMVVFIGAPVIVGVTLVVLGVLTPALVQLWRDGLLALLAAPEVVL